MADPWETPEDDYYERLQPLLATFQSDYSGSMCSDVHRCRRHILSAETLTGATLNVGLKFTKRNDDVAGCWPIIHPQK